MKKGVYGGILMITLGAQVAAAMPNCAPRDDVITVLTEQHQESHRASGLESETGLLEIWASDVDGSWTILLTRPDGQSCIVATGSHWLETIRTPMPKGAVA